MERTDSNWSDTTRIVVILLALGIVVWLAFVASPFLEAVLVAALLAYLFDPLVRMLMRRTELPRASASGLTFTAIVLLLIAIPAAVGTVAFNWLSRLGTDFLTAAQEIEQWLFRPVSILGFRLQPQDIIDSLQGFGSDLLGALPGGSLNILSSVTTNVVWALSVLVMFYYLLKDGPRIKPWLVRLLPDAHQPEIARLLAEINWVWGKFLRIQMLMFGVLSLLMALGTLLIVGLFRFGLLQWSPLGFILLLLLLYTAIQQLDNLWLRPHFLGRQLHLHPGLVFAGLIGALMLSGLLGALIIVPLLGSIKVVGRYVHRKLLGLPPWPTPEPGVDEENVEEADADSQEAELIYRV